MENTTLRLYCKDPFSCAVIKNPAYIPKHGDYIHVENVHLSQPMLAEKKWIAQITYRVENEPYTVWFDVERGVTTIDIHVIKVGEVSEDALKNNEGNTG